MAVNAVTVRNAALHEGLFLQQPFGFASFHDLAVPERERYTTNAMPAAMVNLVCRLVVALLGLGCEPYVRSSTYERSVFRLEL